MEKTEEKKDEKKADFEAFFIANGEKATMEKYGIPRGILKYWLFQAGFHIWKSKNDHTKCYYREYPSATVWCGTDAMKGGMLGNSTDTGRNEYYKFRLAKIRGEI